MCFWPSDEFKFRISPSFLPFHQLNIWLYSCLMLHCLCQLVANFVCSFVLSRSWVHQFLGIFGELFNWIANELNLTCLTKLEYILWHAMAAFSVNTNPSMPMWNGSDVVISGVSRSEDLTLSSLGPQSALVQCQHWQSTHFKQLINTYMYNKHL